MQIWGILLSLLYFVFNTNSQYQTVSYNCESGTRWPQYMNQDQTKIVTFGTPSGTLYPIQIYEVNERNMTLISQPYLKNCQTFKCSGNLQKMLCIDSSFTLLRLFNLTGYEVSFIQQIVLGSAISWTWSVSFSFDGSILLVSDNTKTTAIVYQLSGGLYILIGSYALPSVHYFMTVSPDGLYIVYGETASGGFMNMRIHENNNTRSQVAIYTIATAIVSSFYRISISNPQNGIYTILVIYYINSVYSIEYHQFNPVAGTLINMQTLPGSFSYHYLTLNGNFYVYSSPTQGSFSLYQKVAGIFILVQQFPIYPTGMGLSIFFMSENGGLIAISWSAKMAFFYVCKVANCVRCHWKDMCQTCNPGLALVNNTCVCPVNYTNISHVCIPCALQNCLTCSASNICAVCTNGFTLTNTFTCECASGCNISLKTGRCVQCKVDGCYRCDEDNICEVFDSDPETMKILKSMLIFVTVVLACAIIIITILTIAYIKQIKHQRQQQQQQKILKKQNNDMRIDTNQSLQLYLDDNNIEVLNLQKAKNNNQEQQCNQIEEKGKKRRRKQTSRKINQNSMNANINDINLVKEFNE